MKNVKKILFYLTIFILIILWQLLSGKTTYDYFWSYGFSLKLANGLVAYRDFNMVTTPFTQMFFAIFLFIFGKGIHIYIIFYSFVLTLICYLLDVLYGKNGLVVVALMFISPNILPIFMSSCNYNFLLFLLLLILILCERKKVNPLIIGIVLGLSFFTKQNIGILFILVDLIYSFRQKTFFKKLLGIFIVFLIFFAYFILTNSLYDFFDQCFFGLVNFEKENNYHRGIYFYLTLIIFGVSIVYVIKNKSLERFLLLAYMFIALPLYDCAHFLLSFYAFVLLFEERRFKIFSKVSIQMIILVFQFILLGNIVITNFKEEAIYPNNIKYLNYFYHPKEIIQKNNQLATYLKKYNTYRLDVKCGYLIYPGNTKELIDLLKYLKENNINYFILGGGSNIILAKPYFDVVIKLDKLNNIKIKENIVTAEAGVSLIYLANLCMNNNLNGLAFAGGIPGMVGASTAMNAGAYKEDMASIVKEVKVVTPELEVIRLTNKDLNYSYRNSFLKEHKDYICTEVTLEMSYLDKDKIKETMTSRKNRSWRFINRSIYGLCQRISSKRFNENDEIII